MRYWLMVPLLVGVGLLARYSEPATMHAQPKGAKGTKGTIPAQPKVAKATSVRPPVNRPAPKPQPLPTPQPSVARPAPRPSVPTPSRPVARPAPKPAPTQPVQPARPAIGQRPTLPTKNKPAITRPVAPTPVTPGVKPTLPPSVVTKPKPLPGGLGTTRPAPKTVPPAAKPKPIDRPSVLPTQPTPPATRPGIVPPKPAPKPTQPPIGVRPTLPTRPDRPNVTWPSKPDIRPTPLPKIEPKTPKIDPKTPKIDPKFPKKEPKIDPKFPKVDPTPPPRPMPRPPGIQWPTRPTQPTVRPSPGDRPVMINRPGINNNGSHNTTINNTTVNKTVINQINQSNNYYGGNTNYYGGPRIQNTIYDYHGAWHHNYAYWQRSYHPWYHGCWHGNAFANSWGLSSGSGYALTVWGLNSLAYSFGYVRYVNPFYVVPAPTVVVPAALNYSQPIINVVQAVPESGKEPPPMPETATQAFDTARREFMKGNYRLALDKTELALKDFPNDPAMHQFRALCQFALGDYPQASAAIHAVLASGPGWDWTTMSSLYPDTATYTNHLAALEKATITKDTDPSLWFLLAYHYTTIGQAEAARDAIARTKKLLPNDPVVTQLAQAAGVPSDKPKPVQPPKVLEAPLDIVGTWSAMQPAGGTIGLTLKPEGAFTWTVQDPTGKKESFDGTFTLEDNVLILERQSGGALMGRVTALAANQFQFKLIGSGDQDSGLTFAK